MPMSCKLEDVGQPCTRQDQEAGYTRHSTTADMPSRGSAQTGQMNVNAFVRPAVPAKLRRPINCFEDLRIRGFATLTTVHFGQKLACCWLRNLRQSPRYAANSAFHLLLNWKRAVFAKQAWIALVKASLSAFFCNNAACACTRYADMP